MKTLRNSAVFYPRESAQKCASSLARFLFFSEESHWVIATKRHTLAQGVFRWLDEYLKQFNQVGFTKVHADFRRWVRRFPQKFNVELGSYAVIANLQIKLLKLSENLRFFICENLREPLPEI